MKEIKAIIRSHRLDAVLDALHRHPEFPGVTVSPVHGFGRRVQPVQPASPDRIQYGTTEMSKLECVVNDDHVDAVLDVIQQAAHTGNPGDGKIFVHDIALTVKIRTGARLRQIE